MILIDHPGDGQWILDRAGGTFVPGQDHSFGHYRRGELVGGIVASSYLGNLIALHAAGVDPGWCSRELLWMAFHYCFVQLGVHKVVAPVPSDNHRALNVDLRAGFQLETIIKDAWAPGRHLMVLTMTMAQCRWLLIKPHDYVPGPGGRDGEVEQSGGTGLHASGERGREDGAAFLQPGRAADPELAEPVLDHVALRAAIPAIADQRDLG